MANNLLVQLIYQLILFALLFPCFRVAIGHLREITPRIGPTERLFPRSLLSDDEQLNKHRTRIAKNLMKQNENFTKTSNKFTKTINSPVEIRVVASDRGNNYLYQTTVFLLEQQSVGQYNLSICNVESKSFADLKKFDLPVVTVGGKSKSNNGTRQEEKVLNKTLNKENQDYWKCLGLPTRNRYVLLIEDDSIVVPQFSSLLKSLVKLMNYHENIDYVKLYHPIHLRKLPSWVLMITSSIMISFIVCRFFKSLPILTFLLLSAAMSYDFCRLGSTFAADVRYQLTGSAYISYPESCCTPAVIFRSSAIPEMTEYFMKSQAFSGHAKDHILDESPFTGRQSDVNYVTHIGAFSSVRQRPVFLADLRGV